MVTRRQFLKLGTAAAVATQLPVAQAVEAPAPVVADPLSTCYHVTGSATVSEHHLDIGDTLVNYHQNTLTHYMWNGNEWVLEYSANIPQIVADSVAHG